MLIVSSTDIHYLPFISYCKVGQGDKSSLPETINAQ